MAHAQVVIEAWRRKYNEAHPKKSLGGMTPAPNARTLTAERSLVTAGLYTDSLLKTGERRCALVECLERLAA